MFPAGLEFRTFRGLETGSFRRPSPTVSRSRLDAASPLPANLLPGPPPEAEFPRNVHRDAAAPGREPLSRLAGDAACLRPCYTNDPAIG